MKEPAVLVRELSLPPTDETDGGIGGALARHHLALSQVLVDAVHTALSTRPAIWSSRPPERKLTDIHLRSGESSSRLAARPALDRLC